MTTTLCLHPVTSGPLRTKKLCTLRNVNWGVVYPDSFVFMNSTLRLILFLAPECFMINLCILRILKFLWSTLLRTRRETGGPNRNVSWWQIISTPGVGVAIFALMFAGTGWSWYSASLGPFIKHKYGISAAQTGLVFMAFGLTYTVATPIIGFVTDKARRI